MVVSANRLELLQIADAVAREKAIDKSIVLAAMADAIQKAARARYGQETNIRADINATVAAKMFFGALDEMATNWILSHRGYSLEADADTVVDLFVNGARTR